MTESISLDAEMIDVCVVEDDADQRRLFAHILETAGFSVVGVPDVQAAVGLSATNCPKVLLCDYELPDGNGVELCNAVRQNPKLAARYFILMSASSGCDLPVEVLNAGADDYLAKPVSYQDLITRVRVGLRMWALHDQLVRAAVTDGLTGLYNHDHFNRILDAEVARSHRFGHPLALIMIDMDFFKAINDTYGHLAGNRTLEDVADILRASIRGIDSVFRFGGEEFTIVLPESRAVDAMQVAERIRTALTDTLRVEAIHGHKVTASFGIADTDDPRIKSAADLVDLADRALYLAKVRGRDQVACSYDLDEGAEYVATIQTDEIEWLRRRLTSLSVRAKDVYMQSVRALLQALDEKDPFSAKHSVNVAFYAEQIAEQMGCGRATVKSVYNAALLHDIGKVGVPDRILMKRSSLSPLERMVVEQVPIIGTRIVDHLRILESEIQIIRHQREYFDGGGFTGRASWKPDSHRGADFARGRRLRRDDYRSGVSHAPPHRRSGGGDSPVGGLAIRPAGGDGSTASPRT